MTSDQKRSFERQWPELARALRAILARRGVPASDREDIIQETALRLLRIWDTIDHGRPILPLATTISMNLLRDQMRRPSKEIALEAAADAPARSDVEREGLERVDFQRVVKAMKCLSESHRAVLLQEVDGQPREFDRGPDAMKMLRMRARRRLSALLETASGMVGLGFLRVKTTVNQFGNSAAGAIAAAAVVAVLPGANPAIVSARPIDVPARTDVASTHRRVTSLEARPHVVSRAAAPALHTDAPGAVSKTSPAEEHHPIVVPVGDQGQVETEGDFDLNDVHMEVSDRGGPVPVCVEGVPAAPSEATCPEN